MATRTRMETVLVDGVMLSSRSSTEVSRYEHDCDACIFMGWHFGKYDLYFCPNDKSLIARRGPDGEYKSLSVTTYIHIINAGMASDDDPLNECFKRLQDMDIY